MEIALIEAGLPPGKHDGNADVRRCPAEHWPPAT